MATESRVPRRRIEPIYRPSGDAGEIIVYAGDLAVTAGEQEDRVSGQLELRLFPRAELVAHFAGPASELAPLFFRGDGDVTSLSVPAGQSLIPPFGSSLPHRPRDGGWAEEVLTVAEVTAGNLETAVRFIVHAGPSMQRPRFRALEQLEDGSRQGQVAFELAGWALALAVINDPLGDHDFGAILQATPTTSPVGRADVDRLGHRLFVLLSLLSSREVGVGPICGLDAAGEVVWAHWQSPRLRPGRAAAGWCPGHLVPHALPSLADGYSRLANEPALEVIVERVVDHLLAADGSEVLDVRIPVACTGLELLSWAVLRHRGWIDQDTFRSLNAGAAARLLIRWAELSADLPDGFDALATRRGRVGQQDWGGPELLFNIRNGLVHPPKALDDPQWPSQDELIEAWQLATWYLQLLILRILNYRGEYWSRLKLGRSEMDVEVVPWQG